MADICLGFLLAHYQVLVVTRIEIRASSIHLAGDHNFHGSMLCWHCDHSSTSTTIANEAIATATIEMDNIEGP